jgi:tetratricopeptide (TPR) repeat protein
MPCLSEQTITQYVQGELDEAACDEVESHIDHCPDCRLAVAESARGRAPTEVAELAAPSEPEATAFSDPSSRQGLRLKPGEVIGRYIIRRIVGAGGMGIVYAAYDPKLDRDIALKLLRPEHLSGSEERLDREAKLMARLSHPNVITIYDVGTFANQIYVAMELVVGETLGDRLRRSPKRPWRDILTLFLPAGRGLAAAHREGVIHRDFKPDNVLVGHDGRVRVTDFGLARLTHSPESLPPPSPATPSQETPSASLTLTGALLGTPAYMAPEQLRGGEADALSDQLGFCIALYEGLHRERPFAGDSLAELLRAVEAGARRAQGEASVPAWLRRVVARGLSAEPGARWPSMDALLTALERGLAARRWQWLALGAALSAPVLAFGATRRPPVVRPCHGAAALLVGVWDGTLRQTVRQAFVATGVSYAEDAWGRVAGMLDAYGEAWTQQHTEACEATRVRGEQSSELLDLRMHCLEKQRQELKALVGVYAHADAAIVRRAVAAVPLPTNLRVCADTRELLQPTRLPPDPVARTHITRLEQHLAGLRAQHQAGQYHVALAAAKQAAADSGRLGYAPLQAEAELILGDLQQTLGEHGAAESSYYQALWSAEAGHQDRIAAQAWTRIAYVVGCGQERVPESQRLLQHAEAALRRLGDDPIERAALDSTAGSMAFAQGRYHEAQQRLESSLKLLQGALGRDSLEVSEVLHRLALVCEPLGEWAEALTYERQALAILERRFGSAHPATADSQRRLAQHLFYNEYYEEGLLLAQTALATYQRSRPVDEDHVATALLGVAEILNEMGRGRQALPLTTQALAIRSARRDAGHTDVAEARSRHSIALLQVGQIDQALVEGLQARDILQKTLGSKHVKYAWALSDLGHIYAARGEHRRALESHRQSVQALTDSQVTDVWSIEKSRIEVGRSELALRDLPAALATLELSLANLERDDSTAILLADAYFGVAEVLAELGRDASRRQQLGRQALAIYRRQPIARAAQIAAVERFLSSRAGPGGQPAAVSIR